ncbi:H-2 class II histocompatibility antigen, A-Q alpha chain-like isoform X2 [Lepisosteus oculatus]
MKSDSPARWRGSEEDPDRRSMVLGVFLAAAWCGVRANVLHRGFLLTACQSNVTRTLSELQLDGEGVAYMDFDREEMVMTLPQFADPISPGGEGVTLALGCRELCRNSLMEVAKAEGYPPERKDAPTAMVYPRDSVELGKPNTLICSVTDFHPMGIGVTWTHNDRPVTEGVTQTTLLSGRDFSFKVFSFLPFTPRLGDVYSCQVQHSALPEPLARLWEVETETGTESDIGPTAFCVAGLTLGLLGVAAGTFFLIKGSSCN